MPERGGASSTRRELLAWVAAGPPRTNGRSLARIEAFEDRVPPGLNVAYFVDEREPNVAILRVPMAYRSHFMPFLMVRTSNRFRTAVFAAGVRGAVAEGCDRHPNSD